MAERTTATRVYYRATTASQRQQLFRIWDETGNVSEACRKARVSRGVFYYWRPRFEKDGYEGIIEAASHAPHHPHQTPEDVVERVLVMKRSHPGWGKQRITHELQKANGWEPLVSAPTVGRLLHQHGEMGSSSSSCARGQPSSSSVVRHAEQPDQTVNVDLCFVPASHEAAQILPAVSGSSGVLKVSPPKADSTERSWPGQVFGDSALSYEEAMDTYIDTRTREASQSSAVPTLQITEAEKHKAQKREVNRQEEQLRIERRQVRGNSEQWRTRRGRASKGRGRWNTRSTRHYPASNGR